MARDTIQVVKPHIDKSFSVGTATAGKTVINTDNGIEIKKAFANKNNTLFIIIENPGNDGTLTLKASDTYPNGMIGDLTVPISNLNVIQIQDPSRFENKNGSLYLDFSTGTQGNIYAIAKSVDLVSAL